MSDIPKTGDHPKGAYVFRLYLAGDPSDIVLARDEIERVLSAVAGREH